MWCKTATGCFTLRNNVLSRLCNSWQDLPQFNAADDALEKIQSLKEHSAWQAWSKNAPHSWHGEDNSWRVHSSHVCLKEHAGSLLLKYMAGGRSYTEVVPGKPVWSIMSRARLESSRIISQQLQPPHNGAKLEKKKHFLTGYVQVLCLTLVLTRMFENLETEVMEEVCRKGLQIYSLSPTPYLSFFFSSLPLTT